MNKRGIRLKAGVIALMACLAAVGSEVKLFAEDAEGPKIFYKDGLHIESADGNNTLLLNGRLQTRYTHNVLEKVADTNTFAVQRGEIRLEGSVFTKKLKYGFEMGMGTKTANATKNVCLDSGGTATTNCPGGTTAAITTINNSGFFALNDYYLDWQPRDGIQVKFGQFKAPFLYTELTSAMKQEFPDRNLVHDTFTLGRDLGVDIHGNLFGYHLGYHVFAMNGDGANTLNKNQGIMAGARFEVPILGDFKYSESDVDYTEEPTLGLGLAYLYNERGSAFENGTIAANQKASHGTIDLHFRSHGLFALGQGMLSRTHEGAKLTNWGYTGQAGYFIIPKHLEVAARAGGAVFSNAIANQYEYGGEVGYYFNKHNLKLQTDYSLLMNPRGLNLNDHRIRTQVTLVF